MKRRILLCSVPLLAMAAIMQTSCDSTEVAILKSLTEGCLINSDCEGDLICVFRRCHIQCETTPDCPIDSKGDPLRCMLGTQPEHVCQLEDEKYCEYNSQCPEGQLCGADGECRDRCLGDRDCVTGQLCVQGTCAEPDELDADSGELILIDRPPQQTTGVPCEYDHQCEGVAPAGGPAFVCRQNACAYDCYADVDCDPNEICTPRDTDVSTPGACEPGNENGPVYCTPGQQDHCDCLNGNDGVQICNADGTAYELCFDANGPC